jgi:hypothetical protein
MQDWRWRVEKNVYMIHEQAASHKHTCPFFWWYVMAPWLMSVRHLHVPSPSSTNPDYQQIGVTTTSTLHDPRLSASETVLQRLSRWTFYRNGTLPRLQYDQVVIIRDISVSLVLGTTCIAISAAIIYSSQCQKYNHWELLLLEGRQTL